VSEPAGEMQTEADAARRSGIRYPVAQRHGELVWADRLADARDRVDDLTCIACGDAVRGCDDPTTEPWTVVAAGARDLVGIEQVARDRGARLAMLTRRQFRRSIGCSFARAARHLLITSSTRRAKAKASPRLARRSGGCESAQMRVSGVTMGMFGESAGLFELRVESESAQPTTTARPLLSGDVHRVARRMMSLESW
jgi:hypothetical protein